MKTYILSIFFSIIGMLSQAQESWSLQKCIQHAIQNSLAIQDADLNMKFNELDQQAAKAERHPNLNGNTNIGWNFGRSIDPTSNEFITKTFFSNNWGLNSNVLIYNGGRITKTIDQTQFNLEASDRDRSQTERDIALQVALFYLNVVFAEENIALAESQMTFTDNQKGQLQKLIDAGSRPANDMLELDVQYLQNEASKIVASNSLELNMLQLKQLLRLPPDYDMVLTRPEKINAETDPDLVSFEELYTKALKTQPSIEANELRLKGAEIGEDIAKSALYPRVSASGQLQTNYSNQGFSIVGSEVIRNEQTAYIDNQPITFGLDVERDIFEKQKYFGQLDNNISYGFGMGINIPIYNNKSVKTNIERAKLSTASNANGLERAKDQLKITVQQALIDARAAKRKLAGSEKSLEAQQLAYDNASKRYAVGHISTFEWAGIKSQLDGAQITQLIDRYDYLFKVKILEFYLGKPLKI